MACYGIWKDLWKALVNSSFSISNIRKVRDSLFVVCPFPLDMRYTQVNVFSGIRLLTSLERLPSVIMVVICVLDPPLMRDSSTRWPSRIGKLDDTGFPLKKILTTIIDLSLRQISLLWKKFLKAPSRKNKSSSVLWCQKRLSLRCLL